MTFFIKYVYFCCFDEVSAIRRPKMMTFSITGSQIFFVNFAIVFRNEQKTTYRFIVHNTNETSLGLAYILHRTMFAGDAVNEITAFAVHPYFG